MSIDDVVKGKLLSKAREAARNSYSPYSLFRVGACLLCADGSMFVGCNVENSAFSSTVCAERTAFVQAVAAGKREFMDDDGLDYDDFLREAPEKDAEKFRRKYKEFYSDVKLDIKEDW